MRKEELWKCCYSCSYYKTSDLYISPLLIKNADYCILKQQQLKYDYAMREHSCFVPNPAKVMLFDSDFEKFEDEREAYRYFLEKYNIK